ncbi:MAG TPA: ABC transporter ATP-binding protein [Anaerolineaceae bacterium]|nr:ABC transporter ATP-binding protein [Anaerolineaceae bacterium]
MQVIVENVSKKYQVGDEEITVLDAVSFQIEAGDFLVITGPSGAGKTTLLNLLGTLDAPSAGKILYDGVEAGALHPNQIADFRRDHIGFVFQFYNLIPQLSAKENVMLPLLPSMKQLDFDLQDRAVALLAEVGLDGKGEKYPYQLSGGEQQRVAIARALVNTPSLVLADEPTGNLDMEIGEQILHILQEVNRKQGVTVVLVTHNAGFTHFGTRVIRIQDQKLHEVR